MSEPVPTKLSVNLNKVALLRNQRDVGYPSVVEAARLVVAAGAHGITVHPRPDERHIRRHDVRELAALIRDELGSRVEYNIEGYPAPDFLALVAEVRPDQVTLVPDAPDQATSDHGWDLARDGERLVPLIGELKAAGARVSLFMDPEPAAMAQAARIGADRIELYTGPYAHAFGTREGEALLRRYAEAARAAAAAKLGVNAGHDLNLDNLPAFCNAIPQLAEVSIGHAITADALRIGFPAAVEAYLRAITRVALAA
jgi:pyridoxine 5-phosphate synthase